MNTTASEICEKDNCLLFELAILSDEWRIVDMLQSANGLTSYIHTRSNFSVTGS